jgi:hypothetical protein
MHRSREGRRGSDSGGLPPSAFRGWSGSEDSLFESLAVGFQVENLGVVHESADHRAGGDLVAEDVAHARKAGCW